MNYQIFRCGKTTNTQSTRVFIRRLRQVPAGLQQQLQQRPASHRPVKVRKRIRSELWEEEA